MNRLAVLLLATVVTLPHSTAAQSDRASANEETALFLYNFMLFVRWPADAFHYPSEALRVQVIGRDPFDGFLDRFLAGKSVNHRRIVVTHTAVPAIATFPHVLFVSTTEDSRLAELLASYCGAPVLTVSDIDRFANRGGVVGLVEQDRALHFAINRTAASEARLEVSSKLLHLAVPLYSAVNPCQAPIPNPDSKGR